MRYNLEMDGELIAQFVKRTDAEWMAFELSRADGDEWVVTDNAKVSSRTVIRKGAFEQLGMINGRETC